MIVIQWLESVWQHTDLTLVLNRLVRTRMLGGVGGVPGNRAPIPIPMVPRRSRHQHLRSRQSKAAIQDDH